MPTPYAYTQWCFSCENVKRHEVPRRAISLGGRAIAHHGKMAKKTPEELIILPQKSGEILLEIIMRRYENRSTMMTSNRPIEEWGKLLSDVPAASAILIVCCIMPKSFPSTVAGSWEKASRPALADGSVPLQNRRRPADAWSHGSVCQPLGSAPHRFEKEVLLEGGKDSGSTQIAESSRDW